MKRSHSDYTAITQDVASADEIESAWIELQQKSDCSFFQSWGWIKAWLDRLSIGLQPVAIKIFHDAEVVGLGLFVPREIKRRAIFHSNAMFLNEYPFDGRNMVIEYNGLLAARGHEAAVYSMTVDFLCKTWSGYDEFYFGAVEKSVALKYLIEPSFKYVTSINDEESTCWSIDLTSISPHVSGFVSGLSKNRKAQIRRSIRLYEQYAPIHIVAANDKEQALDFFEGLKVLHTRRWTAKGKRGVFSNPYWVDFHLSLIHSCFDNGQIQILKISSGAHEIGYLYNFIWRQTVYVYQTGFVQSEDKRLMPGYVSHAYAIAYNKALGMATYDLMHGDDLYKRILCNRKQKLVWVILQRRRLKFSVETLAVGVVRNVKKFARKTSPGIQ